MLASMDLTLSVSDSFKLARYSASTKLVLWQLYSWYYQVYLTSVVQQCHLWYNIPIKTGQYSPMHSNGVDIDEMFAIVQTSGLSSEGRLSYCLKCPGIKAGAEEVSWAGGEWVGHATTVSHWEKLPASGDYWARTHRLFTWYKQGIAAAGHGGIRGFLFRAGGDRPLCSRCPCRALAAADKAATDLPWWWCSF